MARKKTADGRRVTVCLKLSEPEAAQVDQARGRTTRGEWARAAVLAAIVAEPSPRPARKSRTPATPAAAAPRKPGEPESAADMMAALRKRNVV